jgi:hypothetical protein
MDTLNGQIEYFAGTAEPVPALLTAEEACRFLRLDLDRDTGAALKSLRRLVDRRLLRPCQVGRSNRYSRSELLRFIAERTEQAL